LIRPTRRPAAVWSASSSGVVLLLALAFTSCALAEVRKPRIGKDTPEGNFLELVSLEIDAGKKIALLEQFVVIFPSCDPAITVWIYADLQDRYRKAGHLDKALAMGAKILAIEPDNVEIARATWRIAEVKGDPEMVKKWSAETLKIAERIVKGPLPPDSDEGRTALERVEFAHQFVANTEYQEYTKAMQIQVPAERIRALDAFLKERPQNPYLNQIEVAEFLAYKELGDLEKTLAAAEAILSHDENRDDVLLFVAEVTFRRKKDPKRALSLATKFIERGNAAEKPPGVSDRDWTTVRAQNLARANYIVGRIHFDAERWPLADRSLRTALPLIGDEYLRAAVLYDLGWANYQMRNAIDAIKFYGSCATIAGPLREQASKSVISIKAEYHLP
jgi:tetratricopeptide (TPR) repeat protein